MAVMSNYTKPIKYLIGTEGDFSIKDWVKNDKDDRKIIFLSNYAMIQETIKPFLTMFADFSIKSLLSLDDDHNRRLFFILDEFGELGKIGTIVPLLTGSRSKVVVASFLYRIQLA
jgi:type IV secretory pathway TraG/TraD family ATPase VirD4